MKLCVLVLAVIIVSITVFTAVNIPHNVIANQIKQLEPYKRKYAILHCHSGNGSTIAMNILRQNGFEHVINAGGYETIKR